MTDYKKMSALDFSLKPNQLIFEKDDFSPAIAWEKLAKDGLYAYGAASSDIETLYFGARYMERTSDEEIFLKHDFMADLTVINPGRVGDEFIKTVGHYHQNKDGSNVPYPEVYESVSGQFEYLLQTEPDKDGAVSVLWVVAEPGDKIVMPPGYGHVSMNVGTEPAVEIDLQKRDNPNGSDYSLFKEKVGGAFYRTEAGLQKNPKYKVTSLRIVKPKEKPEWGLEKNKPLYAAFVEKPEKFDYLINPENYDFIIDDLFEDIEL